MNSTQSLITHLYNFISIERKCLFEKKIQERTKHITIVLEDIYQSRNISASIRSADCFGIQDVHIIENEHEFNDNSEVSMGASKWLDIKRYNNKNNNTTDTINNLKSKGYQIITTTPHNANIELFDININKKTAIIFGQEVNGCSNEALNLADIKMKIPMYGFTESFNVSVAISLCLQYLSHEIRKNNIKWQMTEEEKEEVLLKWLRNTIKSSNSIEKKYIRNYRLRC